MKRLALILVLLSLISIPVLAGETEGPPSPPQPPPCREDCGNGLVSIPPGSNFGQIVAAIVLAILGRR
jgi:hypothetical protein